MSFNDKFEKGKVKGHFRIREYNNKNELISDYQDHNLIVNTARLSMAKLLAGVSTSGANISGINRFTIGNNGHKNNDTNVPKIEGIDFTPTRTDIFAVASNGVFLDLKFNPKNDSSDYITALEHSKLSDGGTVITEDASQNSVRRKLISVNNEYSAEYEITLHQDSANTVIPTTFTEAGLYVGDDLFAMKTFIGKTKDSSTKFIINWTITF